ncbi:MAG TPA: DHA2 family efflux MFS transporter permease subunit [Conexibacter sp.]|jgi:EmrB/QacA subfamily drug resistance transporter|nr:DHA2 family efflux MFS transporter permease subunit [Conexibacter sp.]
MSRTARVAAVVCAAIFMSSLDLFIVNIAFPQLADEFGGVSRSTLSWVLNSYAIVFAALLVPAGRLADLIGRKRVFIGGLLIFTAASAICAAADSVGVLIAARGVQAIGAAALLPTSLALLLPEFPPAKRGAAVGIWAAVGGAAAAAGPPLGGLLVEASWRWVFLVNVPIGIVTAIIAIRVLSETREPAGQRLPDVAGAGLLMLAITALALAIVEGERWGWGSTPIVALFAAAVLLTAAFVARSAQHPSPVVELALLRERPVAAANVGALLFFAGFGANILGGVLFLTQVWGWSTLHAGLALAVGPTLAATSAAPAGRLADRYGQRAIGLPGALLLAAGCAWWIAALQDTPQWATHLLPGQVLAGLGIGMILPTLGSASVVTLPPERFATGTGVYGMSRQIGTAVGVALMVALLAGAADGALGAASFVPVWGLCGGLALATAVAFAAMGRVRARGTAAVAAPRNVALSAGSA